MKNAPQLSRWLPLVLLQLVLVLPFLSQPVHMDDVLYIDFARQALKTPWQPYDLSYIFDGRPYADMASHSHPPFVDYWIALLLRLSGSASPPVWILHAGFLIFPLLFLFGMYRLALRFTNYPRLATALAICSPVAILSSHTLMTDYPCLAFSTLGVALFVDAVDRRNYRLAWLSALPLVLAVFCSYFALVVAMLCWVYAVLKRSGSQATVGAPLIPFITIAGWLTYSSLYFGRFVLGRTAQYVVAVGGVGISGIAHKLFVFPIFLAVLLVPLPLLRTFFSSRLRRIGCLVIATAIVLYYDKISAAAGVHYTSPERLLMLILLGIGIAIIFGASVRVWRSRLELKSLHQDQLFLWIWAAAVSVPILALYTSGMCRYLLPLLPALTLIGFCRSSAGEHSKLQRDAVIGICVGAALGIVLSISDFEAASVAPKIAAYFSQALGPWKNRTRFGAEWGVRYHLLENGFQLFLTDADNFKGGDFVILPAEAVPYAVSPEIDTMLVPVLQKSWGARLPLRLMSREAHAGYYSSSWGVLPFSFSKAPVEQITLKQVSYLVERLPDIQLEGAAAGAVLVPRPAPGG